MEGEKWNLGIKLTSHILSWLRLIKLVQNSDFESQSFKPFLVNEELQNKELDPDVNYYLDQISSLDTKYHVTGEVKEKLKIQLVFSISILEDFKFSAIYLSDTWAQAHKISDSNFELSGYCHSMPLLN